MFRSILMVVVIITIVGSANAGSLEIDRVWTEYDSGYALITYTNDTDATYKAVTIKCVALDSLNKKINSNKRSFYAHEYGPITPGFSDTLKIPVDLNGLDMESMNCNARER